MQGQQELISFMGFMKSKNYLENNYIESKGQLQNKEIHGCTYMRPRN